jgi:hypothetical protein
MATCAQFQLFHTSGCHLCEEAGAMLLPMAEKLGVTVSRVDIAEEDALVEAYGMRIPVLRNAASGRELGWPFEPEQLYSFLVYP